MHIAIVSDAWYPQVNGVVRTLTQTRNALTSLGHRATLIGPGGFRQIPCPSYPEIRLAWRPYAALAQRLAADPPDALHIATEGPLGWAARRWALRQHMPFTTAYHTRYPEYVQARTGLPPAVGYRVLRHFHAPARAVMVPTPSVRDDLLAHGFDPTRVVLWSRGVDLRQFQPLPNITPAPPERPVFLYAGRLAVEKNLGAFLALSLPGEKWVAGDGPQRQALMRAHPDVRFLGMLDAAGLQAAYSAATVFVFPSRTDTFGLVLLEAMACGCPVAAFPVGGPRDVLAGSQAGVLHDDLAQACLGALALSRQDARTHAAAFSWTACAQTFLSYLHPVVQPAGQLGAA